MSQSLKSIRSFASIEGRRSHRGQRLLWVALGLGLVAGGSVGCKKAVLLPERQVDKGTVRTVVATPKNRKPSTGQAKVLGIGWYANVEVDSKNTLHLAWVDADLGDVLYTTWKEGKKRPEKKQVVAKEGAVGSYLRLALAPGDVPIISYYDQDRRQLRLAHRPADKATMQAAGVLVDASLTPPPLPPLVPGERPPPPPTAGMGEGWHGEDVAFGDNVGIAGALHVDKKGAPHLTYYTKGERFRYARRPAGEPTFGSTAHGRFEKLDIDPRAGGSYTMSTDLTTLADGTVIASYCHWDYVDATLRIATRKAGEELFTVVDAAPAHKSVDGWHSRVVPRSDGAVDVYSVATGAQLLTRGRFDPKAPSEMKERETVIERPGATDIAVGPDGTTWILTRGQGLSSLGERSGVWLIRAAKDGGPIEKWTLSGRAASDPWIDLAIRPNGLPVAVWTDVAKLRMTAFMPNQLPAPKP